MGAVRAYRRNDIQPEVEAGDRKLEFRPVDPRNFNVDGTEVSGLGYATQDELDAERKKGERRQRDEARVCAVRLQRRHLQHRKDRG